MDKNKVLEIVKAETDKMLSLIGVTPEMTFDQTEENGVIVTTVSILGDDMGFMIGNHGRHLASLQFVLSNIVRSKVKAEEPDTMTAVIIDIGGYKQQRIEKIEKLAMQKADDARILGEPVDLLPMSPYDRRIVHNVLGKFDDIKTESQGEDRDRYVRIIPLTENELGVAAPNTEHIEEIEE
ncbi:MAG TPA: R3H domain-containing nucleic acid-binding protein [Candidatus Dojkabacteria bacterium]|nr:R3H domain-containing nucleic acid-binding protein [Candidatus Dojkabacteria bacterium]